MYTTVTINPCVDRFIMVNELKVGEIHRPLYTMEFPAGKGIDVSRVARVLGEETTALGIVGGHTGAYIEKELRIQGVDTDFIHINKETRVNTKIVDIRDWTHTEFNTKGETVDEDIVLQLKEKVSNWAVKSKIMSFSGSILPNMPKDIYKQYIEIAKSKGCITFLDATGEVFLRGLEAAPYMVKPNIKELEESFNVTTNSTEQIIELAHKILDYGVEVCTVSMGGKGSIVVTSNRVFQVHPVKVQVKSVVGAGDSFVAGFGVGLMRMMPLEECIKLGTACSTSTIQNEGTQLAKLEQVNELFEKIIVDVL